MSIDALAWRSTPPARSTADDIKAALFDLAAAENRFDQARDPELVDACTLEVTAARKRLNYLLRQAKQEHGLEISRRWGA